MPILYVTAGPQQVTSEQFVDIEGLTMKLPTSQSVGGLKSALLILTVSAPYAKGNDNPGVNFQIEVDEKSVAVGGFTYNEKVPPSFGRQPYCMAVVVPLTDKEQYVEAQWASVRKSTGVIDDFGYASLAAVLG